MRYLLPSRRFLHNSTSSIKTGQVYSKGTGVYGFLGHGNSLYDCQSFKRIESLDAFPVKNVATGMGHSCVILDSDDLVLFGRPYELENLLQIHKLKKLSSILARFVNKTSSVQNLYGTLVLEPSVVDNVGKVVSIRSIGGFNIILNDEGIVYNLGFNRWSKSTMWYDLGDATNSKTPKMENVEELKTPLMVPLPPIKKVDAGLQHCLACCTEGNIYAWGAGERGQLGDSRTLTNPTPTVIRLPKRDKCIDVVAGFHHSAALTESGSLYVWGKYMSLQPKNVKFTTAHRVIFEDQTIPRLVRLPGGRKVKEICGCAVLIAIRADDDTLWVMGLAEGDLTFHAIPIQVMHYGKSKSALSQQTDESLFDASVFGGSIFTNEDSLAKLLLSPSATDRAKALFSKNSVEAISPVILPKNARLTKGHTKVNIIYERGSILPHDSPFQPHQPEYSGVIFPKIDKVYEINLCNTAAFLTEVKDIHFEESDTSTIVADKQYSIVDYSQGWQHSLIIVKEDE